MAFGALLLVLASGSPSLSAQAPGSPILAGGTLGFHVRPEIRIWDSRFGLRQDGGTTVEQVEPLGLDFATSNFGTKLPDLGPTEQVLRDLTGDPTFGISLGASRARLNALRIEIPITASLGITNWLTITGTVPFVRRRMEVDFAVTGTGGTVGFSPGTADPDVAQYLSQFQQAIADVQQAADAFCMTSGEADQVCIDLRAVTSDANLLLAQLDAGYAGAFFPVAETSGATALTGRLDVLRTRMLAAGDSTFIETTWTAPLPFASSASTGGVTALFEDPDVGILAEPLDGFQSVWEVGDVEAGLWVRLLDIGSAGAGPQGLQGPPDATAGDQERPIRLHVAAGATYRFGTGVSDRPDNFVDLGSGDGQNDLEIHGFGYLGIGSRLAASGRVRYGIQMEGEVARRISAPDQPLALAASQGVYTWDPGDYLDVLLAPEFRLTPEISIGARLRYVRHGEDVYSSASTPAGFDLSLLEQETEQSAQYVGGGITLWPSARTRVLGQWPLAASVYYVTAISGSGGKTPDDDRLQLDLRLFFGLW